MSKRLNILQESLKKKESILDQKFENHFSDVRSANGQPLNDKRDGHVTLNRWEKQNDSIRKQYDEIEKTKNAIEREQYKIDSVEYWFEKFPKVLVDLINEGKIKQWRKHPRMMFVTGVEKARIIFDENTGVISHKYVTSINNTEQYAIFRDTYNYINNEQKKVK